MTELRSRRYRICMLAAKHVPDDDRIYYKEARSLARAGFDVWIVSPDPDRIPREEKEVRFASFSRGRGVWGRITSMVWLLRLGKQCNADVYHCHEPESLLIALILKGVLGRKVIFDSHELWGAVFAERFPRWAWGIATWIYQALECILIRCCDASVGASRDITEYLKAICGSDRTIAILNTPATDVFRVPDESRRVDRITICHEGFLTFDRGLKVIVGAIRRLSASHDISFKIVGDVFDHEREWLEHYVAKYRLENVIERTGWLSYEKVGDALSNCDIGIIALTGFPNHLHIEPNKLFNYLLYGIPVVGPFFMPLLVTLENEDGCCITTDCSSEVELAAAIESLLADRERLRRMSENASRVSRQKYRWEHMEPKLVSLYEKVLGTDQSG